MNEFFLGTDNTLVCTGPAWVVTAFVMTQTGEHAEGKRGEELRHRKCMRGIEIGE